MHSRDWIDQKAQKILQAKNLAPLIAEIRSLPSIPTEFHTQDGIHLNAIDKNLAASHLPLLTHIAQSLKPWRKGPFYVFDLWIDSEWKSFIKWQLLESRLDLKGKRIADVG